MGRKFEEIKEAMKKTFQTRDGEGCEYVSFVSKVRVLQEGEFFMFELTGELENNQRQVDAGDQMYPKHWIFGYFVNADGTRVGVETEPVKLALTPAMAKNFEGYAKRFNTEIKAGETYRLYGGETYMTKGTYPTKVFPVNFGVIRDKKKDDITTEGKQFQQKVDDVESIDLDEL